MKKLLFIIVAAMCMNVQAQKMVGGDISLLKAYEDAGTKHLNTSGKAITNVITYLKQQAGMNSFRVRLFVEPSGMDNDGSTNPAVCQDLEYVKALGKRIKDSGAKLMVDFHYSDSWADPSFQAIPASWKKNTSDAALTDSMYSYTKRCLESLVDCGATPDLVQIGNEITYGMLWRNTSDKCYTTTTQTASSVQWKRLSKFLNSAAKAVREVTPEAKIVIHTERSGKSEESRKFYSFLNTNKVDYDIIGLSYYPFFHGYLTDLSTTLNTLDTSFPTTPVMIVETAYYHAYFPSSAEYNTTDTWAATASGQAKYIKDLVEELNKHDNVEGLYYWCPEEAGNGAGNKVMSGWINRGFWWESSQWPVTEAFTAFKTYMTTGIDDVYTEKQTDNAGKAKVNGTYTLSGQRINEIEAPGIYIKDGKKIVVGK